MRGDAARCELSREAPISSELFAFSILFVERASALASVQSGAIRNWPDASRPAPFSRPDSRTWAVERRRACFEQQVAMCLY